MFSRHKKVGSDPSIKTPLLNVNNVNSQYQYSTSFDENKERTLGEIGRSVSAGSLAKAQNAVMSPNSRLWPNPSPFRTLRASFTYDEHNNEVEEAKKEAFVKPHEVFESVCKKNPKHSAIEENGVVYTYREILNKANKIAETLKSMDIVKGSVVAIFVKRGVNVYISMLGILKAQCSYVPIDTGFPQTRVLFTLQNSGAAVIIRETEGLFSLLKHDGGEKKESNNNNNGNKNNGASKDNNNEKSLTSSDYAMMEKIKTSLGHVVLQDTNIIHSSIGSNINTNKKKINSNKGGNKMTKLNYIDANFTINPKIAYIIYTSGTTGIPKGVMVSVRNASHYINVLKQLFSSNSNDRIFQGYSTAFDASYGEIWMAFSGGATLVVGTPEMMQSGADLKLTINELGITILDTTPTNLTIMGTGYDLPLLRIVIVGGEQCTAPVVEKWQPGRRFFNMYGPTETTVSATYAELFAGKPVSIGNGLPGYTVSIRDETMKVVKNGEEGELCIGGKGVTLGYLNAPVKTASKFVFVDGARIYKTGDLVREDKDGSVVFIGRADSQVKIRGYRVELEDIETHISGVEGCKSVVVAVQKNPVSNAQELVAFIVTSDETSFNPTDARRYLKTVLPKYMIPNAFVRITVDEIPHSNISGKVLRGKLPYWSTLELLVDPRLSFGDDSVGESKDSQPKTSTEHYIANILLNILQIKIPMAENIFDYGFNSVSGALLISKCRNEKNWSFLKMKDVYEYTSPRALSAYIDSCIVETKIGIKGFDIGADVNTIPLLRTTELDSFYNKRRKCLVVFLQMMVYIWFALLLNLVMLVQQFVLNNVPTWVYFVQLICVPVVIPPFLFLQAVFIKWFFIGRIKEADYPLYSLNYFKWWLLHRMVINPLFLPGHSLAVLSSRLLGSKIGENVYLACTPFFETDLVEIGNNVTLQPDAVIQTWVVENHILKLRKIKIGNNVYVGERSTIALGSIVGDDTIVHPLTITAKFSNYEKNTEIQGAPGKMIKNSSSTTSPLKRQLMNLKSNSQQQSTCGSFFVQIGILFILAIQMMLFSIAFIAPVGLLYYTVPSFQTALLNFDCLPLFKWVPLCALIQQFLTVFFLCLVKRVVSGNSQYEGLVTLDSFEYLRRFVAQYAIRMLMTGPSRGLTETVFMRFTLRYGMGMDVGEGSEIDVSNWGPKPELVHCGKHCMINGGALLGIAPVYYGQLLLRRSSLGEKTFLGNMSVVPQGSMIKGNTLLGVMSVSPKNMEQGSTYLGSPSFKLPSRKVWRNEMQSTETDLTFNPPFYMRILRLVMNLIKIITQMTMIFAIMLLYMYIFNYVDNQFDVETSDNLLYLSFWIKFSWWLLISLTYAIVIVLVCALGKWLVVCKYRPIQVPMWSCFIWRSDISYEMEIFMRGAVRVFDGTPVINIIYRLFGVDIGENVFLFGATFMEHDLTHIGDNSVVTGGTLQTHLYEDRFYKTGHVNLGKNSLVAPGGFALYDSEMGQNSSLSSHSLLMRNETFEKNQRYFGLPSSSNTSNDLSYEEALGEYNSTLGEYKKIQNKLHDAKIALHDARVRGH